MKVKICGIDRAEFAMQAYSLGCDYLGLLLGITHKAEDKITLKDGLKIINSCPNIPIDKWVMVTHLLTLDDIEPYISELKIKNIQLHDDISIGEIYKLKDKYPSLYLIKAVHVIDETSLVKVHEFEKVADAIILDSRTTSRLGGTGKVHDWNISKKICLECEKPVFLAGGLNPDNIIEAIDKVQPYGVDANSGVEDHMGRKSYEKMKKFIALAKGALKNNE